ncbi:MAG TPA: type I-B CRISPR-associated protein Cas7/Cst2/DevR [Bacteroidales bacterium]|nr:type I-B CRISPR-associated protein Cas7/Cst2/DevR [Bacteroidales bacterium]
MTENLQNQKCTIPNITVTVIFEGSALNRNENIGGNIQSVKKLTINNEEKTFLSKYAIRHYLFETLIRAFNNWKAAKIINDGNVLQFDLKQDNILTCEELDVFGYMNTVANQTRKSPLSITKAISLFPYNQDMAMYANHDLVKRAKERGNLEIDTNPNPFNKEEHTSFYKISFTIDTDMLGYDKWIINEYKTENNFLKLIISNKKDNKKNETKETNNNEQNLMKEQSNEKNKSDKSNKENFEVNIQYFENPINENEYEVFKVQNGTISIKKLKDKTILVTFELNPEEKAKRIKDLLNSIHDGLMAHSSGEANTIIPLFLIASDVKIPSPIFHPFIDVKCNNSKQFEVIGINDALKNSWLLKNIYILNSEKLKAQQLDFENLNINRKNNEFSELNRIDDWQSFLKSLNLDCKTETQQESETNASNESTINTDIPTNGSF